MGTTFLHHNKRHKTSLRQHYITIFVMHFLLGVLITIFAKNKPMNKWLVFTVAVLIVTLVDVCMHYNTLNKKYEIAAANMKAYDSLLGSAEKHSAALQLSISQLENFQDSILKELDKTRKELKVKDKNVQSVQYVASTFTKTDTLVLNDTIFKDKTVSVDTTFGDKWYNVRLAMEYPSSVFLKPEFKSEKHIIVSHKKETVNPPKKFFLLRWFQKKHTVLKVDVVEKNPYVTGEDSRYVEILK